jgi:hypothetical protein
MSISKISPTTSLTEVAWHMTGEPPVELGFADLAAECDWEREHLARCWSCAQQLGVELTGYER